ncbi:MAG: glycoside hydrolase family 3 C-terminal domain-containing protein [Pyrinomonadaceae bacterium]
MPMQQVWKAFVCFSWLILASISSHSQALEINPQIEAKIDTLLRQLTLDEKLSLIAGTGFDTVTIKRLGIPSLHMTDGPAGVRMGPATSFPSGMALAATFDPAIVNRVGKAIAREAKAKGFNVLLGPAVDVQRVPLAGRSFESYGEDPFLNARMGVAYIRGIQSENVIATIKHFTANNQETDRKRIDSLVDERTLNEIYFPPFRAAVDEAGVLAVMSSYNRLNGFYASENTILLTEVLKKRWGFNGLVMSDWGAVHSTSETINAGLDLEMPTNLFLNPTAVIKALDEGRIKAAQIDEMVRRLLRVSFAAKIISGERDSGEINTESHRQTALEAAREGIVLLKNDRQVLPLDAKSLKSIAVIGPNAGTARIGGGGSAEVKPFYSVSPLEGLRNGVDPSVKINFAPGVVSAADTQPIPAENLIASDGTSRGLTGEYFDNMDLAGKPAFIRVDPTVNFRWGTGSPSENFPADLFSNRWTGFLVAPRSGKYSISLSSNDGGRLFLDDKKLIDLWSDHATLTGTAIVELKAGEHRPIKIEHYENIGNSDILLGWRLMDENIVGEAVEAARNSDVAIVFAGLSDAVEAESLDRISMDLPEDQKDLINKVVAVNPQTIVVMTSGAPILMRNWIDKVPAVVQAFYYGQEGGNALAQILLGTHSPSGKLPVTFPKRWEDSSAFGRYPGDGKSLRYSEGVFVGYRWFDKERIEPEFPFGYGLSYTTFQYLNPTLKETPDGDLEVTVRVKNTGKRDGAEAVQIYIEDLTSSVPRPPRELKGIGKTSLKEGETRTVTVQLRKRDLAFYDVATSSWKAEPGDFSILIGSSSRHIRLRVPYTLRKSIAFK